MLVRFGKITLYMIQRLGVKPLPSPQKLRPCVWAMYNEQKRYASAYSGTERQSAYMHLTAARRRQSILEY